MRPTSMNCWQSGTGLDGTVRAKPNWRGAERGRAVEVFLDYGRPRMCRLKKSGPQVRRRRVLVERWGELLFEVPVRTAKPRT